MVTAVFDREASAVAAAEQALDIRAGLAGPVKSVPKTEAFDNWTICRTEGPKGMPIRLAQAGAG